MDVSSSGVSQVRFQLSSLKHTQNNFTDVRFVRCFLCVIQPSLLNGQDSTAFDVQGHGLVISILVLHVVAKHQRLAVCSDGVLANLQLRFASCGQAEEAEAIRFEVIELIRSAATAPSFAILYTLESPGFRNHSASQVPNTLN